MDGQERGTQRGCCAREIRNLDVKFAHLANRAVISPHDRPLIQAIREPLNDGIRQRTDESDGPGSNQAMAELTARRSWLAARSSQRSIVASTAY
jgi:hypothetical protein